MGTKQTLHHLIRNLSCLILALVLVSGIAFAESGAGTGFSIVTESSTTAAPASSGQGGTLTDASFPSLPGQSKDEKKDAENEKDTKAADDLLNGYSIDLVVNSGKQDPDRYMVGLHSRAEWFSAQSVLVSGILFAPEGTEITNAGVELPDLKWIEAEHVYRFTSAYEPAELSNMNVEVDKQRSAFAFLVDLSSAGLTEGAVELNVKMDIGGMAENVTGKVNIKPSYPAYPDIRHALDGFYIRYGESESSVRDLQNNLVALNYLRTEQVSGTYDENTRAAVTQFCRTNKMETAEIEKSEKGITTTAAALMTSGYATPNTSGFMGFLKNELFSLGTFTVEMWMVLAAAAFLLAIILILVLLLTRKKKNSVQQEVYEEYPPMGPMQTAQEGGFQGQNQTQSVNILSIGDEPTVSLEDEPKPVIEAREDEATTDLKPKKTYAIKVRMIYQKQYADQEVTMEEGQSVIIGRSSQATIQTNPVDTSVSHEHGVIRAEDGVITYTDSSRNGTKLAGGKTLKRDESVNMPMDMRLQMEIGSHQIIMMVSENN